MTTSELILKRLTYIKQLYKIGESQSYQHESIAVFSILAFHDSIEMFLKLLSEQKNVNSSKFSFLDYWIKIPDLTLKESMRNLNARRVNIKHRGLLPAYSEIELSRVNTYDFFTQNTISQFGIDFKDISLLGLIEYETVKGYLKTSQKALDNNEVELCVENVAYAFDELIYTYESNKKHWGSSPFFFGKSTSFLSSFHMGISRTDNDGFGKLAEFVDTVSESIDALQDAVKITSFGIDYKEYVKFKILTPVVHRYINGGRNAQIMGKKKWTNQNCQFCIDFVINSALRLQQFDFDIESLEENRFEVNKMK